VKAGDFNGDSVLDLATANFGDSTVSVLLGNANGTFQPAQTSAIGPTPSDLTIGPYPQSVAVGDFNGDGKLDLLVGDFSSQQIEIDQDQLAQSQKEIERINAEYWEASKQLSKAVRENAPPEQREKLRARVIELKDQMNKASMARARAQNRNENHGNVWLLTRK
jgi:DNA-binding beta-propeller fold protein YncE